MQRFALFKGETSMLATYCRIVGHRFICPGPQRECVEKSDFLWRSISLSEGVAGAIQVSFRKYLDVKSVENKGITYYSQEEIRRKRKHTCIRTGRRAVIVIVRKKNQTYIHVWICRLYVCMVVYSVKPLENHISDTKRRIQQQLQGPTREKSMQAVNSVHIIR